jgi:hypothetical protein
MMQHLELYCCTQELGMKLQVTVKTSVTVGYVHSLPTEDAAYICKNMPSAHSLIWGIHLCYGIRLDAG